MTFTTNRLLSAWIVFVFAALAIASSTSAQDMAIINANIATMDRANPTAEALIVKDGRITAVGTTEEIKAKLGDDVKPVSYTHLTLPTTPYV